MTVHITHSDKRANLVRALDAGVSHAYIREGVILIRCGYLAGYKTDMGQPFSANLAELPQVPKKRVPFFVLGTGELHFLHDDDTLEPVRLDCTSTKL